jgi:hypothetical protein
MSAESKWNLRGSYKDVRRRVKEALKPPSPLPSSSSSGANPPSHTPSTQTLPAATHIAPTVDISPHRSITTVSAISQDGDNASHTLSAQPVPTANTSPSHANDVPPSSDLPLPTTSANEVGSMVWAVLETSLRVLKESSTAFPPLKSAVSGLLACLAVFQVYT